MSGRRPAYAKPEISSQVREARYFYLHQDKVADRRLVVICGGRETCTPDYEVDRPTFPYFGIEWVERGRGRSGSTDAATGSSRPRCSATGRGSPIGSGPTPSSR